jgi:hypothetical protein
LSHTVRTEQTAKEKKRGEWKRTCSEEKRRKKEKQRRRETIEYTK